MDENEVGLSSTSSERFDDPMNPLEEWIPTCAEELKHAIGIVFDSLGDGLEFNTSQLGSNWVSTSSCWVSMALYEDLGALVQHGL
ncbi:hypothetical protein JHK86_024959 [Glycine max]|nr:hypothetical protein JHK86_024959 [Glycine max]